MKSLKYILILSLCFVAAAVFSQQTVGLHEIIDRGLENNFSIRIATNQQEIDANNATWGNAGFLPTVDASGGYSGTANTQRQTAEDGAKTKNTGINSDNYNAGLNVNWTIFDGLSARMRYEKLKELAVQGEVNTLISIEDLVAGITGEYYNLLQQKIRLKNYEYAVSLSQERLRIDSLKLLAGTGSGLDVLQAQVDLNSDNSALIKQRQAIVLSQNALKKLTADSDFDTRFEIADTAINLAIMPSVSELWGRTLEDNSSLFLIRSDETIAYLDYKATRSEYFPNLRFSGGYGYQYSRSDASNLKNQSTLGFNYGLTLGINIFDGNKGRNRRNARIGMDNAALARENFELSLKTELYDYWTNYRNNLELLEMEQQNLQVAKRNYQLAMESYRLGSLSGIELREAQQSLLNAEEKLLAAEYNTKIFEVQLMLISGRILEYGYAVE